MLRATLQRWSRRLIATVLLVHRIPSRPQGQEDRHERMMRGVEASANSVIDLNFDRQADLAVLLERSFADRIQAGATKTERSLKELGRSHSGQIA
jgi:hypothetical protein